VEELVEALVKGSVRLHELDRRVGSNEATRVRRRFLEQVTGTDLSALGLDLPYDQIVGRNCENTIGAVSIPVGVAGPLPVEGSDFRREVYVPLATTEGALVATVNRGASAIRRSGWVRSRTIADRMTRAPVLETPDLDHSIFLARWVEENFERLRAAFRSTTSHGDLVGIVPFVVGKYVFLRMEASTGDAMGMNMVTRGAQRVVEELTREFPWLRHISVSGNLCTDKKATSVNWIMGRGKSVSAEAVIRREVVESVLKRAGTIGGFSAHVANVIAAIFIATGQDPAQVVESSMAITYAEVTDSGDLYVSLTLPSLEVGTVGGGTWLPAQRAALSLMGVAGSGDPPGTNARRFAEIVAAAALAGELSLLAALSSHHLVEAHERLGRSKR
jgi:hydroxymethylglutaryl-CoA reductase (NADPH)